MSAPTLRTPATYSTAIQQTINSGKNFDGTMPTGDSPLSPYGLYKYAAQDAGGLFYWDANEPIICGQFHCDLGGSGNFSLYLAQLNVASVQAFRKDGTTAVTIDSVILIEEQTSVNFVALDEARFKTVLLPYQGLKLVTGMSSAVQVAQAVASIERTYIR